METLRKYAELGRMYRTEPCQEYPGIWWVIIPDDLITKTSWGQQEHGNRDEALKYGERLINHLEAQLVEYDPREIKVYWQASDDDPRIGQDWFTHYYQVGSWSPFGFFQPV